MASNKRKFTPQVYDECPTIEVLQKQYDAYCKVNGNLQRKVGMTIRSELRYGITHRYHSLTDEHHFAIGKTQKVAREIEVIMMDILKEAGEFFEHRDFQPMGTSKVPSDCNIVYLAVPKSDGDQCLICKKVWLSFNEDRQAHINMGHVREKADLERWKRQFTEDNNTTALTKLMKYFDWMENGISKAATSSESQLGKRPKK